MSGKHTILLCLVIVLATASAASARMGAPLQIGPEWYVDSEGHWHSIRSDWRGIERPLRARRLSSQPSTEEQ
jgi:hypothetical protein